MLSAQERERLANAIREAEARTAGEIVVVVAGQASGYRSVPILWALLVALVTPWPLIRITTFGPSRIFMAQLATALVLSFLFSLPKRRYALVPNFIKRARAHEAATREFVARGLARTQDRTGVMIYVALAEHYAEVLADSGIADRVDDRVWRETIESLIMSIKAGRLSEGLIHAVEKVGAILAAQAPPRSDDSDELANKVILI
jgi:putative membrane protein